MQKKIPDGLARLRTSVGDFSVVLVRILAKCFCYMQAIGELKTRYDLPTVYVTGEQNQVAGLRQLVMDNCLNPDFAENFLNFTIRSDSP
ncbi:chorismate mutase [Bartonella sp. WD12.1]|uniref:chorismate mutase n=1 Tax=Bartonella sp. WD12.1 TaxID=1933903 RepID=UPI0009D6120B|nr:chorismate mutase [Bartonella sp. WD12.1]OPB30315.1 chorismate mutase [Bartonella sp. WD12.1]